MEQASAAADGKPIAKQNNQPQPQVHHHQTTMTPVARKRGRRRQQSIPDQPNGLDRVFIWDIEGSLVCCDTFAESHEHPSVLASVNDKLAILRKQLREAIMKFCQDNLFLQELELSDQMHIDDVPSEEHCNTPNKTAAQLPRAVGPSSDDCSRPAQFSQLTIDDVLMSSNEHNSNNNSDHPKIKIDPNNNSNHNHNQAHQQQGHPSNQHHVSEITQLHHMQLQQQQQNHQHHHHHLLRGGNQTQSQQQALQPNTEDMFLVPPPTATFQTDPVYYSATPSGHTPGVLTHTQQSTTPDERAVYLSSTAFDHEQSATGYYNQNSQFNQQILHQHHPSNDQQSLGSLVGIQHQPHYEPSSNHHQPSLHHQTIAATGPLIENSYEAAIAVAAATAPPPAPLAADAENFHQLITSVPEIYNSDALCWVDAQNYPVHHHHHLPQHRHHIQPSHHNQHHHHNHHGNPLRMTGSYGDHYAFPHTTDQQQQSQHLTDQQQHHQHQSLDSQQLQHEEILQHHENLNQHQNLSQQQHSLSQQPLCQDISYNGGNAAGQNYLAEQGSQSSTHLDSQQVQQQQQLHHQHSIQHIHHHHHPYQQIHLQQQDLIHQARCQEMSYNGNNNVEQNYLAEHNNQSLMLENHQQQQQQQQQQPQDLDSNFHHENQQQEQLSSLHHHNHHHRYAASQTTTSAVTMSTTTTTSATTITATTTSAATTTLRTVLNNHHKQLTQRLSVRFHRIRVVYNMNRNGFKSNENSQSAELQETLAEIDHYTLDWRKNAMECLRLISESPNCTNIIITKLPLVVALGHLVSLDLARFFDIDQVYSASKTNKEACLKRIRKRFGATNRCSYIIVGDKEDVELAKKLDLPSWPTSRSDGHKQLVQLYTACKEGFLM